MQLFEMFSSEQLGHATEKDDNTALSIKDMRKTKLTLSQINRLRQMKDIRELEQARKLETLGAQYGTAGGQAADANELV